MDRPAGKDVKTAMEDLYREEINHGRLYPNLDELADKGLIDKRQKDKRTNEYVVTRRGSYVLAELRRFVDTTIPLN
ncbi:MULTISPECIES: helix-turn-helix transcriptional regulator [unclassified Haloferax]|uniref:helix-turn-helix transcriptional regulator n=1 Tax=unclassified Haloferax TaxID=2625095 RepID=UPI002874C47A|nr:MULTISPECIES: helix-turn-helix transcriptional regulator [unclassified Haloferax]MDS0243142.1 PadR family transcriptional regulator [Haloferax sp. S2CR25]MDS0446263.1 PadR family transcriptional regulator [Haloferax sp. S2CR25-2]